MDKKPNILVVQGVECAMTENGKKATDKQCTEMCLYRGAKYVFVNGDKVVMIKNHNFADLKKYAGDRVLRQRVYQAVRFIFTTVSLK